MYVVTLAALAIATVGATTPPRYVMYFDQWHTTTLPPRNMTLGVNHVITAFAGSDIFNHGSSYTPFIPLSEIRELFDSGTKVCMAIGGWGDNSGFGVAAATEQSRKTYAENIATALDSLGYDCVDIDWEYPGGNGEDYKRNPNSAKALEITNYPLLLLEIKTAIGTKELSIAVPGREEDMIAFTPEQVPKINAVVDYVNVKFHPDKAADDTTDRIDTVQASLQTIDTYIQRGMTPSKMNLGFAFYAKWFTTQEGVDCNTPTGCPVALLEAPNGSDTGLSGAVTFEKQNYNGAFLNAMINGIEDTQAGGQWYWDAAERIYWTWDTPEWISRKFTEIVIARKLGGVMAWSLAQDSYDWSHLWNLQMEVRSMYE